MPRNAGMILGMALVLVGLGPDDPQEARFKKEMKALAGTWRPISAENNGIKASESSFEDLRWDRDSDGTWTMRRGKETVLAWTVQSIDASKEPRWIDIKVASGSHKGVIYRGIYELDGDTLRICFAMPDIPRRPTEFSAGKGSVCALSEFKRER